MKEMKIWAWFNGKAPNDILYVCTMYIVQSTRTVYSGYNIDYGWLNLKKKNWEEVSAFSQRRLMKYFYLAYSLAVYLCRAVGHFF